MRPLQTSDQSPSALSIRLPALIENLPEFIEPLLALADRHGLGQEKKNDLELAVEEALVNIFRYAYPGRTGMVELTCRVIGNNLEILIADEGLAFSVTEVEAPNISEELDERKIGGLGILLLKSLMTDVRYKRQGNRNLLELLFSLHSGEV